MHCSSSSKTAWVKSICITCTAEALASGRPMSSSGAPESSTLSGAMTAAAIRTLRLWYMVGKDVRQLLRSGRIFVDKQAGAEEGPQEQGSKHQTHEIWML